MALPIPKLKIPTLEESLTGTLLGNSVKTADNQKIRIDSLVPFDNQPFKLYSDEKLKELAEDIKLNGVLSPVIVRPNNDNTYQILAGHNRTNAAKLAGLTEIPCIIKDVDDTTAQLILVNSNLNQRQELLPSEKAFAYKMQVDALKHSGTNCPNLDEYAGQINTNRKEIFRYIRLTKLFSPLLQLVDEGKMPVVAGINLSFISPFDQEKLFKYINNSNLKISLKQSEQLKELDDYSEEILEEVFFPHKVKKEKPKQTIVIQTDNIKKYFQSNVTQEEIQEIIIKALDKYFE